MLHGNEYILSECGHSPQVYYIETILGSSIQRLNTIMLEATNHYVLIDAAVVQAGNRGLKAKMEQKNHLLPSAIEYHQCAETFAH